MSEDIAENAPTRVEKTDVVSIESSCNTLFSSNVSKSNTYNVTNNYTFGPPINVKKDETSTIEDQMNQMELIPNDLQIDEQQEEINSKSQKVLRLIWKYLSKEEKLSCTLVCKSFNSFISEIDYFSLIINLPPTIQVFPILSRDYKSVLIRNYKSCKLEPLLLKILKSLSHCLIDFKFVHCCFNLKTLCKLLHTLPLLNSLELNISSKMEEKVVLSIEDLPKLFNLKNLKVTMFLNNMNGILEIFGASNIQSLTVFSTNLNMNELETFFKQHRNSLSSIYFRYCVFFVDLNYSQFKFAPTDFSCFDCLYKLRKLVLINSVSSLNILKTKCINWLTHLELYYRANGIILKDVL